MPVGAATHRNYNINWTPVELQKITAAEEKALEIQSKTNAAFKMLVNCPLIHKANPKLAEYKSRLHPTTLSEINPFADQKQKAQTAISNIEAERSLKVNFKLLNQILSEVDKVKVTDSCEKILSACEIISIITEFAKSRTDLLKNTSLNAEFFGQSPNSAAITDSQLRQQIHSLERKIETLYQEMLKAKEVLLSYEKFLTAIEMTALFAVSVLADNTNVEIKKLTKEIANQEFAGIVAKISATDEAAYLFLSEVNPERAAEEANKLLNFYATIPFYVRLQVLQTLCENNQAQSESFKQKALNVSDTILREPETLECSMQ